jgi:SAM-dependent methyltransferase/ketosteroid isomerase-like protein
MNDIIHKLVAAANDHDPDAMVALFHAEYRSLQPAHPGRAFVGRAQVGANWVAMFAGIPDVRIELSRVVEDGDTTWCEWTWSGTRTDEQPFEARGVALFQLRDDLIVAGTLYMEDVETEEIGVEVAVEGLSGRRPGFADDPFGGRHPTSHERQTGRPWNDSYRRGPAPWDRGSPQPAIVRLASEGGFAGAVLDAGCGTGENALLIASLGLPVLGVDVAETALAIARAKAHDRRIEAEFATADAFQLERLGRMFETVLDCGLFHTFDGSERPGYVASLASVTEHHGTLYVLCFSDEGPAIGPHPVSQDELRDAFDLSSGWKVAAIEPERIQTRYHDDSGAPAWLATVERT